VQRVLFGYLSGIRSLVEGNHLLPLRSTPRLLIDPDRHDAAPEIGFG